MATSCCAKVGDAARINTALLHKGVIVRPVASYGLPEWLRISVGLPEENERFLPRRARRDPRALVREAAEDRRSSASGSSADRVRWR
jgi:hypothetical protein